MTEAHLKNASEGNAENTLWVSVWKVALMFTCAIVRVCMKDSLKWFLKYL